MTRVLFCSIPEDSAAGRLLVAHGVTRDEFNSYGTRRGNHEILTPATFANIRLRNEMVAGVEGPYTRMPNGTSALLFEAGMGVMPLQFEARTTRKSLRLDGSENYDVTGLDAGLSPRCTLTLEVTRTDGTRSAVPVTCRLDTHEEIAYFNAGGLLPMMCERLLRAA
ncbi:MAG: hypothetical protein ACXWIS_20795 [Burkholderiales bacterium]